MSPSQRGESPRTVHVPVMLHEVLSYLDLAPGLLVVDGTTGAGGHSAQIIQRIGEPGRLIGIDRDPSMLARARQILPTTNVQLQQGSYAELPAILDNLGIQQVDRILLDLGLSSDQLADRQRGFGFDVGGGPLDMRFDITHGVSAAQLLAQASAAELQHLFETFGEERRSREIAAAIVQHRQRQPLLTAEELAQLVSGAVRGGRGETHPATKVFQALRIAVNEELVQLETFLKQVLPQRLKPGGKVVIISFHSLEDRLVKQSFREVQLWDPLTPKPVVPTPSEIRLNPRSRSALLRAALRK